MFLHVTNKKTHKFQTKFCKLGHIASATIQISSSNISFALSWMSFHVISTCRISVKVVPIANLSTNIPSTFACVMNARPLEFTASRSILLIVNALSPSNLSLRRKHTKENLLGTTTSNRLSIETIFSNCLAIATSFRICSTRLIMPYLRSISFLGYSHIFLLKTVDRIYSNILIIIYSNTGLISNVYRARI